MPKFLDMYYQKSGTGAPILLLHGWGASSQIFHNITQDLADNFTVYAVDFWGFGKSEKPSIDANLFDYTVAIAKFCLEIIKSPCVIVGHSFGGRVAILLSAKYPQLVSKLVLVDSAGMLPRFNLRKALQIKKYKKLKHQVEVGKKDKSALDKFGSADFRALPNEMKKVFVCVVNLDLVPFAKRINTPTLIFWGKKDKDTPIYMAKRLNHCIKNSKLMVVNGGHFSFLDVPKKFLHAFYRFVLEENL